MMHKILFITSLMLILFVLYQKLVYAGTLINRRNKNNGVEGKSRLICSSTECARKATDVIENMDQSVDPCDDFYQFICGNYIKSHKIAEDKVLVDQMHGAQDKLDEELIDIVKAEVLSDDLEAFKKLKLHYKNCLDEDEIKKVGKVPLVELLDRLGGWPVLLGDQWKEETYRWEDVMSSISKEGFDPGFPIKVFVDLDPINSRNHSLQLTSVVTEIDGAADDQFIEAYKSYLVGIAVLLGAEQERANSDVKDLVDFEQKLSEAHLPQDQLAAVSPLENQIKISNLSQKYPELPWLDMINRILSPSNVTVSEDEFVVIRDPKFISELGPFINSTPKRVLANYQIYNVIKNLVQFLPEEFRNLKLAFLEKKTGLKKWPRREKFCLDVVRNYFDVAISSLFVRTHFNQQTKNTVIKLIKHIREETKVSLEKLEWMDDYTRQGALKKVEHMKILAAYPDELFDDKIVDSFYENLNITTGKFFDNIVEMSANDKNLNFNKLRKPAREFEWMPDDSITSVNAFYNPVKNMISIEAGILQEPYFDLQWPDYLKYGGIGGVIGHEITHGFDDTGRKYDYEGNYKDWWNNKTATDFERKVQCQIDQYNNYTIKQVDKKINGKLTIDENIADSGGIKLAYHAYVTSIKNKKTSEKYLPNLNYTPRQMFWISAATVWCEKITDQYLKLLMVKDPHSPGEARINVVFSNTEEFAKDFKCPVDSMMNPSKRCEVW